MNKRVGTGLLAIATIGSAIGSAGAGHASAAGGAPIVTSGSVTVHYEDVYSINFTASDPEGDPLTVTVPPANSDWISCDKGPATDFNCEYSSSDYYSGAALPTTSFVRTISYTVSDGTSTSTGVWTVTVLPPPTMELIGKPVVTEGSDAVLQLKLSSNTYGPQLVRVHAVNGSTGDVVSTAPFIVDVADGATTAEVRVPTTDNTTVDGTRYFTVSVDAADAIPYRFVTGGNTVTVLDNDAPVSTDTTAPVVAPHRNLIVERTGDRAAYVRYTSPSAIDAVDGSVPTVCTPGSQSVMPVGSTAVKCSATDAAGNTGTGNFQVTVRRPTTEGVAKSVNGGHGDRDCVAPGQYAWVSAGGFTPGSQVKIELQSPNLDIVALQTATADRKGRVRQMLQMPTATAGDSDVLLTGTAGNDDFVRMLPLRVAKSHHREGLVLANLRNRDCD